MIYIVHILDQGELVAAAQLPEPEIDDQHTLFTFDKAVVGRIMAAIATHDKQILRSDWKPTTPMMPPPTSKG